MGTSASQGCNARHHSKACLELTNIHLMRNNATDRHSKGTEGGRSEREEGEGRKKERKKREERERELTAMGLCLASSRLRHCTVQLANFCITSAERNTPLTHSASNLSRLQTFSLRAGFLLQLGQPRVEVRWDFLHRLHPPGQTTPTNHAHQPHPQGCKVLDVVLQTRLPRGVCNVFGIDDDIAKLHSFVGHTSFTN